VISPLFRTFPYITAGSPVSMALMIRVPYSRLGETF
jgi:hypothetical protein